MTTLFRTPSKGGNEVALNPGVRRQDVQLANYLASMFRTRKPADMQAEASGYVRDTINPVISNLTDEAKRMVSSGSAAIGGITDTEARRLGAIGGTVRADNTAAQAAEQKAGDSLRDYLEKEGAASAADVSGRVAGDAPQGSALADAAAASGASVDRLGKGIAGESAGRSYTGLSSLIAHGQTAEDYADSLPGLARLEGQHSIGDLSGRVTGDLRSKTDALIAQIPGMTADVYQRLTADDDQARAAKAQALSSFYGGALDRNTQAAIAKAGLGKDAAGQAIDWTATLGFKTDANGNPVYDTNGNLIPTEKTVKDANSKAGKDAKAHAAAVKNLGKARDVAASTVRALATKLSKASISTQLQPVTPSIPSKLGKYKKQGGGFTNNPAEAEQKKGSVAVPAKSYAEIFKLALAQPEVQVLAARFALKPAEVAAIVQQGLAAAGVNPPAAKPKAAPDSGPTIPGASTRPGLVSPPGP